LRYFFLTKILNYSQASKFWGRGSDSEEESEDEVTTSEEETSEDESSGSESPSGSESSGSESESSSDSESGKKRGASRSVSPLVINSNIGLIVYLLDVFGLHHNPFD